MQRADFGVVSHAGGDDERCNRPPLILDVPADEPSLGRGARVVGRARIEEADADLGALRQGAGVRREDKKAVLAGRSITMPPDAGQLDACLQQVLAGEAADGVR